MKQTITVTRALVELKRLNDRIETAIVQGKFVGHTIGKHPKKTPVGFGNASVEDATRTIQSSFDKVESLIRNRQEIKSKIVTANATTFVVILDKEMTVAEAIELKNTVIFRKNYLQTLRSQLLQANQAVDKANTALDTAIETSLNAIYGSDKAKIDESLYSAVAKPQKEQKEAALLDPCDINARIEQVQKDISDLESELDFVLSESNAKTTIEVDLTA